MYTFRHPNEPRKEIKKKTKKKFLEISVQWVFTCSGAKYSALTVQDQEIPS